MLKKLIIVVSVFLFGCSNMGFDTVASISLKNFDKQEFAFYQNFSIKSDGVYTVSIRFYEEKNDETGMGLMSMLGFHFDETRSFNDYGVPIYTYFEIKNSHELKIYENTKNYPTTFAVGDGRVAYLGKVYLKEGHYKILFYVRQKNKIFAKTRAQLNIGNVSIGK